MFNKVTDTIYYVGVNDYDIDLFEGQYKVPNGIAYNSYIINDYKTTVVDTVDKSKTQEWLNNIGQIVKGTPEYLLIQHMEPDHAGSIEAFLNEYPGTTLIGNQQIIGMIDNFFPNLTLSKTLIVESGQSINLGKHNLTFAFAPMVHWPEVMMTYESTEKVLFSADGFGKFGALDVSEDWVDEARRYYIGIVGKYGNYVQDVLKVAGTLDIQIICPTHGPVLTENLEYYIGLYDKWSSYQSEEEGICICYTSVYGSTRNAAKLIKEELLNLGEPIVEEFDLARCDIHEAVAIAFKYNKLVLATTTYNGDMFPLMHTFVHNLMERNYQNRTVGIIENGSWAPQAARCIRKMMGNSKDIKFADNQVTIMSQLNENDREQIRALAKELTAEYRAVATTANQIEPSSMFKIGYGLYVVTSNDGTKDNGLIVNSVSQVSNSNPTIISVNVNKVNYSAEVIKKTGRLNISVLDQRAPFEIFKQFGFQSGRDMDKFDSVEACSSTNGIEPINTVELDLNNEQQLWSYVHGYINRMESEMSANRASVARGASEVTKKGAAFVARSSNGLYYLNKYANAYISAKVKAVLDMETHCMFVCEVTESANLSNEKTMTYDYYQSNVKPVPAKKKAGYVCKVCGYIYEGEILPNDIVCEICKHGAGAFELLR